MIKSINRENIDLAAECFGTVFYTPRISFRRSWIVVTIFAMENI